MNPVRQRKPLPLLPEHAYRHSPEHMFTEMDLRSLLGESYQPERREPAEVVFVGGDSESDGEGPTACEPAPALDAASYMRAAQHARTRAVAEGMLQACEELERVMGLDEAEAERARSEEGE